jgi:hypothetical protein
LVQALVLASGYYFPTTRGDVLALSGPAIPVLGDIVSPTLAPLLSRLMWPAMLARMFGPRSVPAKFAGFPKEMAIRPSQIRASAAETALMIPAAAAAAIAGAGHMVQQSATDAVMAAIDEAAEVLREDRRSEVR